MCKDEFSAAYCSNARSVPQKRVGKNEAITGGTTIKSISSPPLHLEPSDELTKKTKPGHSSIHRLNQTWRRLPWNGIPARRTQHDHDHLFSNWI
jgi:hypothetical protein